MITVMEPDTLSGVIFQRAVFFTEIGNKYDSLFIDERITYSELPEGYRKYEIMEEHGTPCCIQNKVLVNFYGTLITPFDMSDQYQYTHSNGEILGINLEKGFHKFNIGITNNFVSFRDFFSERGVII